MALVTSTPHPRAGTIALSVVLGLSGLFVLIFFAAILYLSLAD